MSTTTLLMSAPLPRLTDGTPIGPGRHTAAVLAALTAHVPDALDALMTSDPGQYDELATWLSVDSETDEDLRAALVDALQADLARVWTDRTPCLVTHDALVTGGESAGDEPTDEFAALTRLNLSGVTDVTIALDDDTATARVLPVTDSTIVATTFTFTVLHPRDLILNDLTDALAEADTGHAVGAVTGLRTAGVPDAAVPVRLRALGNDGSFFDADLTGDTL